MRLSSFAGTDVGRTRSGNEDSHFCGRTVFAVADGLGGHQGGEVASAAAVAPLAALDGREFADPAEAAEALAAAIREANAAIIDQAAIHPERSILTRAVGLDPRIPVDTPDPLELAPGDQVLLCSDGLTEAVPDPRIAELLTTGPDGDAACRALIDAANDAGGPDNITVVLIRVG
jgi:serine/threonine protein phosphatase PrpC